MFKNKSLNKIINKVLEITILHGMKSKAQDVPKV